MDHFYHCCLSSAVQLLSALNHSISLFVSVSQIILRQLVAAAKALQDKCIFHRDIKVENILIETGSDVPRVRLIDFGLSCFVKKTSLYRVFYGKMSNFYSCSSLIYPSVTLTFKQSFSSSSPSFNHVCIAGTSAHVPPEWYSRFAYRAGPTTVWQMGVVLFDCLHRKSHFDTTRFLRKKLKINNRLSKSKKNTLKHTNLFNFSSHSAASPSPSSVFSFFLFRLPGFLADLFDQSPREAPHPGGAPASPVAQMNQHYTKTHTL